MVKTEDNLSILGVFGILSGHFGRGCEVNRGLGGYNL